MATIASLSAVTSLTGGDLVPVFSTSNGDARKASMTVVTAYVASNLGNATCTTLLTTPTTVALLPSAVTLGVGTRAFVTDATATTFASTVSGGGSNKVPVYSDGTNWKIG